MEDYITLARFPQIPQGFCLVLEKINGEDVWFLRRIADDRRIRIKWRDGEKRYTAKELSAKMYQEGDSDNPLLKGLT